MKRILLGIAIALLGVSFHMLALWTADQYVEHFPTVTDVLMRQFPYVNLYGSGEVVFWLFLASFATVFFRERPRDIGYALALVGLLYASRGIFLLLLPIGPPLDAPQISDRFVLYPYPDHAFFPGGHVGLMFLFSLLVRHRRIRLAFVLATILFGIGSVLARAHYTADILGGLLLGYAVVQFGKAYLEKHFRIPEKEQNRLCSRKEI